MTRDEMKQALRCCIVKDPDDKKRCPDCPLRDPASYCTNRLFIAVLAYLEAEEKTACGPDSCGAE